jgi:glycosyltransferase involved in cell wall biosynthesis
VHLEALASGVPVLSSRMAGGSELVASGKNGWVIEEIAGESIAAGLDRLRDGDAGPMAAAARAAAEPFTYAAQVDRFLEIYRGLAR